jgi:DNA-binding beta-propeller fold protein YncE
MKRAEIIILAIGLFALGAMVYLLAAYRQRGRGALSSPLFDYPQALAFDAQGNLYVANHGHRTTASIVKVSPVGHVVRHATGLPHPTGMAVDGTGNLFVATERGRIFKVASDGGVRPFEHRAPEGDYTLAFDPKGHLYAAGTQTNVMYRIAPDGQAELLEIGCCWPGSIGFDRAGILFAVNRRPGFVLRFDPTGDVRIVATVRNARCLAFDRAGNMLVGSADGSVHRIDLTGRARSIVVQDLNVIRDMALSPIGDLYLALTETPRGIHRIRLKTPGRFLP